MSALFVVVPLALVVSAAAVWAFCWSVSRGQMDDLQTTISGSADVVIASTGTSDYPSGVTFGFTFKPLPGSYYEVTQ